MPVLLYYVFLLVWRYSDFYIAEREVTFWVCEERLSKVTILDESAALFRP